MNNPLQLDASTASGRRFASHIASFQSGARELHQGIFNSNGYCSSCGITCPHHFDKITCSICCRSFHTSCLQDGTGRSTVAAVVRNPSLWWFCLECLFVCNSVDVVHSSVAHSSNSVQRASVSDKRRSSGEVVYSSSASNSSVTSSAFQDELQARLTQMESQIYNRLKSDLSQSLTQLSIPNDLSVEDSRVCEESAIAVADGGNCSRDDEDNPRDSGVQKRRNGRHFSDDNAVAYNRKISSSSGFSESEYSSKSNSLDKSTIKPTLTSTPKPCRVLAPTFSSSRHVSCPQLNELDSNTVPVGFSATPPSTPKFTKSTAVKTSDYSTAIAGSSKLSSVTRKSSSVAPRKTKLSDTTKNSCNITDRKDITKSRDIPSYVTNERRRKNNNDLDEIKKLISLSKGINYNNKKFTKRTK